MQIDESNKMEYLYIPTNVRRRKEIIDGIGTDEIIKVVVMTLVGFLISTVIYMIYQQIIIFVLLPPIMAGFTLVLLKKNRVNYSTLDLLQIIKKFYSQQNTFLYKYYDRLKSNNQ